MAKLYIVATPIGNLEDITFRAIRTLQEVDTVLCEDTRVTSRLLNHYEIKKPMISYHANSALTKTDKILQLLEEGKDLALVSDAGTPTISDPGVQLVQIVREKLPEVEIIPIPGASALIAALSVAGVSGNQFTFFGFLPHKKGRQTMFLEINDNPRPSVFYESPHRIIKTLESLKEYLTNGQRVIVAREITKMFEQLIQGTPEEVLEFFNKHEDNVRGEFVVIIDVV